MIKIKKVTQLEDIKAGDYIRPLTSDLYEQISEVIIDSAGIAFITYGKDAMKDMCEQLDLMNYEFAEIELGSEDIAIDIVYRCNLCHNPHVVFDSQEQALHHSERCLFNPKAKKCVMCKHLKIIEEPPYPRYQKEYQSTETYHAFGAYKQPYCMLKEQNITEYELFDNHDDCFEYSDEPIVTEQTEEMNKYMELVNSDLEVQKTTIGEMLKNED
jgi:hypothetical protein